MAQKNANIRQERCTMDLDATLTASFDMTKKGGSVHVGKAVAILANGQVGLVATDGQVFGKLEQVYDDGTGVVVDEGWIDFPTDGTSITYGSGIVGGATAGTVKTGTSANFMAVSDGGTNIVRAKDR